MPGNPNRLQRMDAILADPAQRTPERMAKRQALAEAADAAALVALVIPMFAGPIYSVAATADLHGINADALTVALDRHVAAGKLQHIEDGRYTRYAYPERPHERRTPPAKQRVRADQPTLI